MVLGDMVIRDELVSIPINQAEKLLISHQVIFCLCLSAAVSMITAATFGRPSEGDSHLFSSHVMKYRWRVMSRPSVSDTRAPPPTRRHLTLNFLLLTDVGSRARHEIL